MGWETFELPPTRTIWLACLVQMVFAMLSDYLYVLAMLKTTPMCESLFLFQVIQIPSSPRQPYF